METKSEKHEVKEHRVPFFHCIVREMQELPKQLNTQMKATLIFERTLNIAIRVSCT